MRVPSQISEELDEAKKKLLELQRELKNTENYAVSATGKIYNKNTGKFVPNSGNQSLPYEQHTGATNILKREKDRQLQKDFNLKSDEVVRVLKVGESVIPKGRNKGSIARNSDIVNAEKSGQSNNNDFISWINVLKESMQNRFESSVEPSSSSTNISPIDVSIGDIIIQGNADNSIIDKLNEARLDIVKEVFTKINKHTNLSGFRNVKSYV